MKRFLLPICIVALLAGLVPQVHAQEGAYGAGAFFDFYVPLFNFRDMYDRGTKFGGSFHYQLAARKIVEVEYHYAKFTDGSLEDRTFRFSDGKDYKSPQASAEMKFNSASVNWLFSLREKGFGEGASGYATFGAGLYDYSSKVSGLIFVAQVPSAAGAPPDQTLLQEPINDTRTSFSANFGGGVMIGMGGKAALDLRVRYNLIMGELRPFLAWGVEKTFPFNLIDVGVGLKFNLN